MSDMRVVSLDRLELAFAPFAWPFAQSRRRDIDEHFEKRRRASPAIWNGRVLLMREHAIASGTLRGVFFETGFADFIAWRDWDFPDCNVVNCFAMAALRASCGAYVMGVMGEATANPGRIYFPAGTPDLDDVRGRDVDLFGNVMREIAEETGLTPQDFTVRPGWSAVVAGPRLALMKPIEAKAPAEEVHAAVLRHLEHESSPELADVRIVRSIADFDPMMPEFVKVYLSHVWAMAGEGPAEPAG